MKDEFVDRMSGFAQSSGRSLVRSLASLVVFALMVPAASAGVQATTPYDKEGPYSKVLEKGPYEIRPYERVMLESDIDGVAIEVGLWLPDVPQGSRVPIIVRSSPYFAGSFGTAGSTDRETPESAFLVDNFVPHGYGVAAVAIRGTGFSGGCMDFFGPREVADLRQAIDWLGTQPWSAGRIGVVGLSYDGSAAWEAAASGSRYVKTIVPIAGVVDVYGLINRYGTTMSQGLTPFVYYSNLLRVPGPGTTPETAAARGTDTLCPEAARAMTVGTYTLATGAEDPIGFWRERNHKAPVKEKYRGSILLVQGLFDWGVPPHQVLPWAERLKRKDRRVHQMLGAWGHAFPDNTFRDEPFRRWDWAETLLQWFDYWLKFEKRIDLGPAVQVQDQTGQWRFEKSFPPLDAREQRFVMDGTDALVDGPAKTARDYQLLPLGTASAFPIVGLPGEPSRGALADAAGSVAEFLSEPLDEGGRISGVPKVTLSLVPQGPTGLVAAEIVSVSPEGTEERLTWTHMNLSYADGGTKPTPLIPGDEIIVSPEFQPMDGVVLLGHRLLLRVWQVAPEVNFDYGNSPMVLKVGAKSKSWISIPTIERDGSTFFSPP